MGNRMLSSFVWKFLERTGSQAVNLIVQIVLARMIAPSDFGVLAILIVFVNFANIFIQKGLSSSLIRKREVDKADYDTAFIASFGMAVLLYLIIFIFAPFIAKMYKIAEIEPGLRVIGISLFFGSLYCIQNAILVREMRFRAIFYRGMTSSVMSGALGIFMAMRGFGVWALVAQTIGNQVMLCLTALPSVKWRPGIRFSLTKLKEILSFGGRILVSEVMSYFVESSRTLLIGGAYSSEMLSYYERGQTYPSTLMRGIYDTIGSVLLPEFSREQDNLEKLAAKFKSVLSLLMFIVAPIFVGLAAVAPSLIPVLLTEVWNPAIAYMVIFSFAQLAQPIQGICRQAIYACGQSKVILRIEIIKDVFSLAVLILALRFGVFMIALSFTVSMYFASILMLVMAKRIVPITYKDIIDALIKTAINCFIMFVAVYAMNLLTISLPLKLCLQIVGGGITYMILAVVMRDKNFKSVISLAKRILHRK